MFSDVLGDPREKVIDAPKKVMTPRLRTAEIRHKSRAEGKTIGAGGRPVRGGKRYQDVTVGERQTLMMHMYKNAQIKPIALNTT